MDLQLKDYDFQRVQKDESVRLETTLSKEQFEMLMKCRDLASHSLSQNHLSSDWADVLEVIMNYYLKEKGNAFSEVFNSDLKKVTLNNLEKEHKDGFADEQITTVPVVAMHHNKTLTPKTRQEIFKRDQFCRYKDSKTGRICGSTYALQVDHKVPRWAKGDHSHDNLQILCGAHNRWKYRKEMRLVYK